MASPRSRQAARVRERRRRAQRRARRLVALSLIGVLGLITLLLTAFGSGSSRTAVPIVVQTIPANAEAVRPRPQMLATIGNLQIQLPVAAPALTAIGFHGTSDGSLSLQPVGRQANEGILARLWRRIAGARRDTPRWYQLEGGPPGTNVLDVGTAPGTDVYAPVDGSVVAVRKLVVGGRRIGSRIDLRPSRVAVGHGLRDERAARPGDRSRHAGARRVVEARDRRRHRGRGEAGARGARPRRRQQRLDLGLPLTGLAPLDG